MFSLKYGDIPEAVENDSSQQPDRSMVRFLYEPAAVKRARQRRVRLELDDQRNDEPY